MNHSFLDFQLINIQDAEKILAQCQGKAEKGVFLSFLQTDVAQKPFLEKILGAVQLDLERDSCYLEKTAENNFSFSTLNKKNQFHKALFFGISPQNVGLQIKAQPYQPFSINNCQFLFADSLTKIEQTQSLKKALWLALQQIFK